MWWTKNDLMEHRPENAFISFIYQNGIIHKWRTSLWKSSIIEVTMEVREK